MKAYTAQDIAKKFDIGVDAAAEWLRREDVPSTVLPDGVVVIEENLFGRWLRQNARKVHDINDIGGCLEL